MTADSLRVLMCAQDGPSSPRLSINFYRFSITNHRHTGGAAPQQRGKGPLGMPHARRPLLEVQTHTQAVAAAIDVEQARVGLRGAGKAPGSDQRRALVEHVRDVEVRLQPRAAPLRAIR